MRQRLTIIVTIVVVLGVLIALNATTYVHHEPEPDSEVAPNRSTYHSGATGTRALYDVLSESGYKVMRWREAPGRLLSEQGPKVQSFVIIGGTKLPVEENDAKNLLLWVERGGWLVLINRNPEIYLLPASGAWAITTELLDYPWPSIDPANPKEMTEEVKPVKPVQPTLLTREVESVMASRFASIISITPTKKEQPQKEGKQREHGSDNEDKEPLNQDEPPPAPVASMQTSAETSATPAFPAPVVHLSGAKGALLLDYPKGRGRIIVLSDPYIVSNGGISLKDNLQLAVNILASGGGLIAFDEYHQGRGTSGNALVTYFAGTPILPIFGQVTLVILAIIWTQGRRFARPLPLPQIDRRSSLEFVASMAELQHRAHAFDLAIENIYSRTRRVLARYSGLAYNSPRAEIASRAASRSSLDQRELESLMRSCEEAINGSPITEQQSVQLVRRLRNLERTLGLRMRSREIKQAAEKI
jgi:uncharacterized protein DUF4350